MPKNQDIEALDRVLELIAGPPGFGDITPAVVGHLLKLKEIHGENFELEPVCEWLENASKRILDIRNRLREKIGNITEDYSDEYGRVIPHLVLTNQKKWPQGLKASLGKTLFGWRSGQEIPKQGTSERFLFDQAVRFWVSFTRAGEVERWIQTQSGGIEALCGSS